MFWRNVAFIFLLKIEKSRNQAEAQVFTKNSGKQLIMQGLWYMH